MTDKPADLLLGVLAFFGVLIPGAVVTALHGNRLLGPFGLEMNTPMSAEDWIPAFFAAIVIGHVLHGASD